VKKARENVRAAELALYAAILAAHRSGETLRDIGEWAGYSYQRIHEIVREQERREQEAARVSP
jgi:hypothetical protein